MIIHDLKIVNFSSENPQNPASNLLLSDGTKKWKCLEAGEKSAFVIFSTSAPKRIYSIEIGNEFSAFVEIQVSRNDFNSSNYQVLLGSSSFMSPLESRSSSNAHRVRFFSSEYLSAQVSSQSWSFFKVICTQPFNKQINYGLSFITFHQVSNQTYGAFTTKELPSPLSIGGLFASRNTSVREQDIKKKDSNSNILYKASKNHEALPLAERSSFSTKHLKSTEQSPSLHSSKPQKSTVKSPSLKSSKLQRSLSSKDQESTSYKHQKSTENSPASVSFQNQGFSSSKNKRLNSSKNQESTFHKSRKSSENSPSSSRIQGSSSSTSKIIYKPFSKLFEGIVLCLSGFVNPLRSTIRSSGLSMGASYKDHWDSSCTHLICAFKNTPKFIEVKRYQGKIVRKEWILEGEKQRKRMNWKKYALEPLENLENDENEVWEMENKFKCIKKRRRSSGREKKNDEDEIDTDDEIEEIKKRKKDEKKESKITDVEFEENNSNKGEQYSKNNVETDSDWNSLYDAETDEETSSHESENKESDFPILPSFFEKDVFYFDNNKENKLSRHIIAFGGIIHTVLDESVTIFVSESGWNEKVFSKALSLNPNIVFVRPNYIEDSIQSKNRCIFSDYEIKRENAISKIN